MVLTDVLKRWQVLKGRRAILCTGTDEHGMKVQQASEKAKTPPKEFCDKGAAVFKELAASVNLSNDHFIRTTDLDHKDAVQYFWYMLNQKGYIYESKHEGWYCVSDETFYPETATEMIVNPSDGRVIRASKETGKEVVKTSEVNYLFRLSAFKDRLLDYYKDNPNFVVPQQRMNEVVGWVSEGLSDLSISRSSARLKWGIPVPDDASQTMYVWLDALVNYITKAGYPWAPGNENAGGWPADLQVIGKDITRFHCIYWPAFLMALDIPPPKQILAHAHWTIDKKKMSKSDGTGVDPVFAMERFGVDAMRYYLALEGGITDDASYGNSRIVVQYKKGLQHGVGNLVSRIARHPGWSIRESVKEAKAGKLPAPLEASLAQVKLIAEVRDEASFEFDQLNPGAALQKIMSVVYETNKYLAGLEPWKLVRHGKPEDYPRVLEVVYHSAEALRVAGILLQPYMPSKASRLLDMLGVDDSKRSFNDAQFGVDGDYGVARAPVGKGVGDLFPPLPVED
jgi:methionyl-tRNA synthetase